MTTDASSPQDKERVLTPEEARYELQAILGQLHGLMSKAVDYPAEWCPPDLIDSLTAAYGDIGRAFGALQAELNTGTHDEKLAGLGLAGEQMNAKKRGFWHALRRFFDPTKRGQPPFFGALGSATRWGGIIVGSLSREIPGGEIINECIEVFQAAREQYQEIIEAKQDETSSASSAQTSKPASKRGKTDDPTHSNIEP